MTLRLVVSCAVIALYSLPALASGGKLVLTSGDVWTQAPGASEATARAGSTLVPGTRIRTGKTGQAKVVFADGSKLEIKPSSSLMLSKHKRNKKKKNSVLLFFGRIWNKVARSVGGAENYEVKTANAVCGVRGTVFETAVADDGSVRVRVTSGIVGVGGEGKESAVGAGQEIEGDENGVGESYTAEEHAKWRMWEKRKRERLRKGGIGILGRLKGKIMSRKAKIEALRSRQIELVSKRKSDERRARAGDSAAIREIRKVNEELAIIADAIADIADVAETQFGLIDHFADLASDPRFKMIDRKTLEAEAASLRRIKADLDKMVAEGTDISIEAMNDMLDDMSSGQRGSLKSGPGGSAADDLFGGEDMDFKMK